MSSVSDSTKNPGNSPSRTTLIKYVVMALLAFLSFGLTGLGAIVVMFALSTLRAGRDSAASHGISSLNSSRLGGVAIVITFILFLIGMVLLSSYTPGVVRDVTFLHLWSTVFVCVILGGVEDIKADLLSPYFRLVVKLLVFRLFPLDDAECDTRIIGVPGVDYLLSFLGLLGVSVPCFVLALSMPLTWQMVPMG